MTPLDERALAEHLERRAKQPVLESDRQRDARLLANAMARLDESTSSWRSPFNARASQGGLAAAVVLVSVALATGLVRPVTVARSPEPSAGTSASAEPTAGDVAVQVLDAGQIAGLVDAEHWATSTGRVVIVEAPLSFIYGALCLAGSDCMLGFFEGTAVRVFRTGEMDGKLGEPSAPLAVRIRGENDVALVGHVQAAEDGGFAWRLHDFTAAVAQRLAGFDSLYVVDAWLSRIAVPLFCPVRLDPSGQTIEPGPVGCGDEGHLQGDGTQPNAVTFGPNNVSWTFNPPDGSLPVQNGAYGEFAPRSFVPPPSASEIERIPPTQRGMYLTRPVSVPGTRCGPPVGCWYGEIVARLDAIDMKKMPSPPASAEPGINASKLILTPAQLDAMAFEIQPAGRVVVADVSVESDGSAGCLDCVAGHLTGMERPIDVLGELPDARRDPPLALEFVRPGAVRVLAHVEVHDAARASWTVPELLNGTALDLLGSVYLVDGWLSPDPRVYPCPMITPAPSPDEEPGCGVGDFLSTNSEPLSRDSQAGALGVVLGAYQNFALDHSGAPQHGIYLITHVEVQLLPACTTDCPPSFRILARISPSVLFN